MDNIPIKGTTVIAVKRDGKVAIAGDGQVTFGNTVLKHKAKKIRRLYKGQVLVGLQVQLQMHSLFLKD